MSVDVIVLGAGGFGREALDVIEAHNRDVRKLGHCSTEIRVIGIADDCPTPVALKRIVERNYKYLGTTREVLTNYEPQGFIIGIGDPQTKCKLDQQFTEAGWHAAKVVHPSATIGSRSVIGEGAIICAGTQVSTNTRFGRHVHLNPNSTIGHDAVLQDYVSVNPGAVVSGDVEIQARTLVGAGAVILQGLNIGFNATIGASACVTRDVASEKTMIGVPAFEA